MTLRRRFLALAAVLALAAPAAAQDQEDPEPEVAVQGPDQWDRLLAGSVVLGLDTPFGIGGVSLEVSPVRYLAIYAGGGAGRDGGRVAGGLRGQVPMENAALGLMLGFTGGPLDWGSGLGDARVHRYWDFALFFHAGVSMEYRFRQGFFGRLAFGIEGLLEPTTPTACTTAAGNACGAAGDDLYTPVRGWIGLSVGYALEL